VLCLFVIVRILVSVCCPGYSDTAMFLIAVHVGFGVSFVFLLRERVVTGYCKSVPLFLLDFHAVV